MGASDSKQVVHRCGAGASYVIDSPVGSGCYGTVYKVRKLDGHKSYALKIERNVEDKDPGKWISDCKQKAKMLSALKHKVVIKCYEYFPAIVPDETTQLSSGTQVKPLLVEDSCPNAFCLVMEFVPCELGNTITAAVREGGPLSTPEALSKAALRLSGELPNKQNPLRRSQSPSTDVLKSKVAMARELARGFAFLHRHCVYHRDLKPDNILMRTDGTPVIADFGVSIRVHYIGKKVHDIGEGNLFYSSPERLLSQKNDAFHDDRSEVYSLSLVLLEFLTGENLYKRVNEGNRGCKKNACDAIKLLNELCQKLWEQDPIVCCILSQGLSWKLPKTDDRWEEIRKEKVPKNAEEKVRWSSEELATELKTVIVDTKHKEQLCQSIVYPVLHNATIPDVSTNCLTAIGVDQRKLRREVRIIPIHQQCEVGFSKLMEVRKQWEEDRHRKVKNKWDTYTFIVETFPYGSRLPDPLKRLIDGNDSTLYYVEITDHVDTDVDALTALTEIQQQCNETEGVKRWKCSRHQRRIHMEWVGSIVADCAAQCSTQRCYLPIFSTRLFGLQSNCDATDAISKYKSARWKPLAEEFLTEDDVHDTWGPREVLSFSLLMLQLCGRFTSKLINEVVEAMSSGRESKQLKWISRSECAGSQLNLLPLSSWEPALKSEMSVVIQRALLCNSHFATTLLYFLSSRFHSTNTKEHWKFLQDELICTLKRDANIHRCLHGLPFVPPSYTVDFSEFRSLLPIVHTAAFACGECLGANECDSTFGQVWRDSKRFSPPTLEKVFGFAIDDTMQFSVLRVYGKPTMVLVMHSSTPSLENVIGSKSTSIAPDMPGNNIGVQNVLMHHIHGWPSPATKALLEHIVTWIGRYNQHVIVTGIHAGAIYAWRLAVDIGIELLRINENWLPFLRCVTFGAPLLCNTVFATRWFAPEMFINIHHEHDYFPTLVGSFLSILKGDQLKRYPERCENIRIRSEKELTKWCSGACKKSVFEFLDLLQCETGLTASPKRQRSYTAAPLGMFLMIYPTTSTATDLVAMGTSDIDNRLQTVWKMCNEIGSASPVSMDRYLSGIFNDANIGGTDPRHTMIAEHAAYTIAKSGGIEIHDGLNAEEASRNCPLIEYPPLTPVIEQIRCTKQRVGCHNCVIVVKGMGLVGVDHIKLTNRATGKSVQIESITDNSDILVYSSGHVPVGSDEEPFSPGDRISVACIFGTSEAKQITESDIYESVYSPMEERIQSIPPEQLVELAFLTCVMKFHADMPHPSLRASNTAALEYGRTIKHLDALLGMIRPDIMLRTLPSAVEMLSKFSDFGNISNSKTDNERLQPLRDWMSCYQVKHFVSVDSRIDEAVEKLHGTGEEKPQWLKMGSFKLDLTRDDVLNFAHDSSEIRAQNRHYFSDIFNEYKEAIRRNEKWTTAQESAFERAYEFPLVSCKCLFEYCDKFEQKDPFLLRAFLAPFELAAGAIAISLALVQTVTGAHRISWPTGKDGKRVKQGVPAYLSPLESVLDFHKRPKRELFTRQHAYTASYRRQLQILIRVLDGQSASKLVLSHPRELEENIYQIVKAKKLDCLVQDPSSFASLLRDKCAWERLAEDCDKRKAIEFFKAQTKNYSLGAQIKLASLVCRVSIVHVLRLQLTKDRFVGFMGHSKGGKSSCIGHGWDLPHSVCERGNSHAERTLLLRSYTPVSCDYSVVDTPGMGEPSRFMKDLAPLYTKLFSVIVVVVTPNNFRNMFDSSLPLFDVLLHAADYQVPAVLLYNQVDVEMMKFCGDGGNQIDGSQRPDTEVQTSNLESVKRTIEDEKLELLKSLEKRIAEEQNSGTEHHPEAFDKLRLLVSQTRPACLTANPCGVSEGLLKQHDIWRPDDVRKWIEDVLDVMN